MIVEDQAGIRKGLQMRFSAEADLSVIGEAADGLSAIDLAKSLYPDVVLLDVEMPGMDGIQTARALRFFCPRTALVMLSIHDDTFTQAQAKAAGASAFVAKSLPTDELLATIRQVASSHTYS